MLRFSFFEDFEEIGASHIWEDLIVIFFRFPSLGKVVFYFFQVSHVWEGLIVVFFRFPSLGSPIFPFSFKNGDGKLTLLIFVVRARRN